MFNPVIEAIISLVYAQLREPGDEGSVAIVGIFAVVAPGLFALLWKTIDKQPMISSGVSARTHC